MRQTSDVGLDDVKSRKAKAKRKSRATARQSERTDNNDTEDGEAGGTGLGIEGGQPIKEGALENGPNGDKEDENGVFLVVGIDFGTTYSGGVRRFSGKRKSDGLWPGTEDNRHKVPTTLATGRNVADNIHAWGYEVMPHMTSCSWFKLMMAGEEHEVPQDDPLLRQAVGQGLLNIPEGYRPEDLCQKYLKALHDHVLKKAEQSFGKNLLKETRIKYVMTVPADWGDVYKEKLKDAATDVGIASRPGDKITFISEPEAAAQATFQTPMRGLSKFAFKRAIDADILDLKPNINAVIVDMGGGTVDLITYRILKSENPIRVTEACAGNSTYFPEVICPCGESLPDWLIRMCNGGGKCGGTTIDRALHELMTRKYGAAFSGKDATEISHGSRFMRDFESIKRKFEDKEAQYKLSLTMPLENAQGYDSKSGNVILTRDEIAEMFSPVIDPTLELLIEQIAKSKHENKKVEVEVVVLCGGLSGSTYVQDQIRAFCDKVGIEVITPEAPWSAIARGAVLYGMRPRSLVEARKCRQSYGMRIHRKYDPEQDANIDEKDIVSCPFYGKRVENRMAWHVRKEDTIKKRPARIHSYISLDKRRRNRHHEIHLYKCNSPNPPDSVTDEGVQFLCTLKIDLTGIRGSNRAPRSKRTGRNQKRKVDLKVDQQVIVETDEVQFAAKVNRKEVGCKKVRYETVEELDDGN